MPCRPWFSDYLAGQIGASRAAGQPSLPECGVEAGRTAAEAFFSARGLSVGGLSAAEYGLARAVYSEAGGGTPEEKVAIAEATINHWRYYGKGRWSTMLDMLLSGNGGCFGAQSGSTPPLSTARDPYWIDVLAARVALSGASGNFARGAIHYFSGGLATRNSKGERIYDAWSRGNHWVGDLPGVEPRRQCFMAVGEATPAQYAAGFAALDGNVWVEAADVAPCSRVIGAASMIGAAAVVGVALWQGLS